MSVLLFVGALGLGYSMGRRWGGTVGSPHGMWYGMIAGFAIWVLFLRPRQKLRRQLVRAQRRNLRRERRRLSNDISNPSNGDDGFEDNADSSDDSGGDH